MVYCVYETKEQGLEALETLLKGYVEVYGYDIKSIRETYCPLYDVGCKNDYKIFKEIYEKLLKENK